MYGDDAVAALSNAPIRLEELSDRRLGGDRQRDTRCEALVELVGRQVHAVQELLLAKPDFQRHDLYPQLLRHRLGDVPGAVRDYLYNHNSYSIDTMKW